MMRGRILVVDDEPDVVSLLQKYLTLKQYEVYTATNGLDAIQKAKDIRLHIVLLDIIMTGMGGIQTMQEIKKINPQIVVFMLTAVTDEELAKKVVQLGADDYIPKPINLDYIGTCLAVKMIQLLD